MHTINTSKQSTIVDFIDRNTLCIVGLLILLSIGYLFIAEARQHDPTIGKDWWAVYFVDPDPSSPSLDFTIDNFTDSETKSEFFTYEIVRDGQMLESEIIEMQKASSHTITTEIAPPAEIHVTQTIDTDPNSQKTLYKK